MPKQCLLRTSAFNIATSVFFLSLSADPALSQNSALDSHRSPLKKLKYQSPRNKFLDLRGIKLHVANSRNAWPTASSPCNTGRMPVNRYPLIVTKAPRIRTLGGLIDGSVPLQADWLHAYCNSSAFTFNYSPEAKIEGVRIRTPWDGMRVGPNSRNFLVQGVWISDAKDDCIENDHLLSGEIRDALLERCFSGISVDPGKKKNRDGTTEIMTLNGVYISMGSSLHKGQMVHASPLKMHLSKSPNLKIYNSIFLLDNPQMIGIKRLRRAWQKIIDCRNNVLLWATKAPLPREFPALPRCFTMYNGDAALAFWRRARQNWIDCHPHIERFTQDPPSVSRRCIRSFLERYKDLKEQVSE